MFVAFEFIYMIRVCATFQKKRNGFYFARADGIMQRRFREFSFGASWVEAVRYQVA